MDENQYKRIQAKIEKDSRCKPQGMYFLGATGPTGPTGPAGDANSTCCDCVDQMRNIVEQIINLYPNNNLFVTIESGDTVLGKPGQLISGPSGNAGIFEVISVNPSIRQLVSLCSLDFIRIDEAVYNELITYLPAPIPLPTGCCTDCESSISSVLPVGTPNVSIITNTQMSSRGTVIRNEYGMIVLADEPNNNISFISTCKIDLVYLSE